MTLQDTRAQAAIEVKKILGLPPEGVGRAFDVLIYSSTASPNIYRQRARAYDAPVSVVGHIHYNPTPDMLSAIGSAEEVEGMITISRGELVDKFPLVAPEVAIDNDMELGFDSLRWRVVSYHRTGDMGKGSEVFVVLFDYRKGQKLEAYP